MLDGYYAATEIQAREFMRQAMYLDASIYQANKPLPMLDAPAWFYNAGTFNLDINLNVVGSYVVNPFLKQTIRRYGVNLVFSNMPRKELDSPLTTNLALIDVNGREVLWSVSDVERFLIRAAFPVDMRVNILISSGGSMAGKWNKPRSDKLLNAFNLQSEAVLLDKAALFEARAFAIKNGTSKLAQEYIVQAQELRDAAAFRAVVATKDF